MSVLIAYKKDPSGLPKNMEEKETPVDDDRLIVLDSEDSYVPKSLKVGNLPASAGAGHTIYDAEGNAMTQRSGLQFKSCKATDSGGKTIIQPWQAHIFDWIPSSEHNKILDYTQSANDHSSYLQTAFGEAKEIFFPKGLFSIGLLLNINQLFSGLKLLGQGPTASSVLWNDTHNYVAGVGTQWRWIGADGGTMLFFGVDLTKETTGAAHPMTNVIIDGISLIGVNASNTSRCDIGIDSWTFQDCKLVNMYLHGFRISAMTMQNRAYADMISAEDAAVNNVRNTIQYESNGVPWGDQENTDFDGRALQIIHNGLGQGNSCLNKIAISGWGYNKTPVDCTGSDHNEWDLEIVCTQSSIYEYPGGPYDFSALFPGLTDPYAAEFHRCNGERGKSYSRNPVKIHGTDTEEDACFGCQIDVWDYTNGSMQTQYGENTDFKLSQVAGNILYANTMTFDAVLDVASLPVGIVAAADHVNDEATITSGAMHGVVKIRWDLRQHQKVILDGNTSFEFYLGITQEEITAYNWNSQWQNRWKIDGTALFRLHIVNGGNYTIAWPASVKFGNNTEPALKVDGESVLEFYYDGEYYWGRDYTVSSIDFIKTMSDGDTYTIGIQPICYVNRDADGSASAFPMSLVSVKQDGYDAANKFLISNFIANRIDGAGAVYGMRGINATLIMNHASASVSYNENYVSTLAMDAGTLSEQRHFAVRRHSGPATLTSEIGYYCAELHTGSNDATNKFCLFSSGANTPSWHAGVFGFGGTSYADRKVTIANGVIDAASYTKNGVPLSTSRPVLSKSGSPTTLTYTEINTHPVVIYDSGSTADCNLNFVSTSVDTGAIVTVVNKGTTYKVKCGFSGTNWYFPDHNGSPVYETTYDISLYQSASFAFDGSYWRLVAASTDAKKVRNTNDSSVTSGRLALFDGTSGTKVKQSLYTDSLLATTATAANLNTLTGGSTSDASTYHFNATPSVNWFLQYVSFTGDDTYKTVTGFTENYKDSTHYSTNTGTGALTVLVAGKYLVQYSARLTAGSNSDYFKLRVHKNSNALTPISYTQTLAANGTTSSNVLSQIVDIAVNDIIYFKVSSGANTGNTNCYINDVCVSVLRVA